MRFWLLAAVVLVCSACYRVAGPAQAGDTIRLEFAGNQSILVRAQPELQRAISAGLVDRLGWRVGPQGRGRLVISIAEEQIGVTAGDRQGIPGRWRITFTGTALYESDGQVRSTTYAGIGHASGLIDEEAAIARAADDAAAHIVAWLELSR